MDEKTARRYRGQGTSRPPLAPRVWRTRPDVFAEVWRQVQARLEADSQLQAVTLFRELLREHPGRFQECHRRTFERRVNRWRALTGPARPVFFAQVHRPGRLASFDFTEVASLGITLQGAGFPHLLFHGVLTHSNVESARICFSESWHQRGQDSFLSDAHQAVDAVADVDQLDAHEQPYVRRELQHQRDSQNALGTPALSTEITSGWPTAHLHP